MPPSETIDTVLDAFLHEQRARLSDRTYRNYEDVIRLLRDSLNMYAYSSLSAAEAKRWQKAFDAGDEEAFCHLFGPQGIPPHLGEFLGYFMGGLNGRCPRGPGNARRGRRRERPPCGHARACLAPAGAAPRRNGV